MSAPRTKVPDYTPRRGPVSGRALTYEQLAGCEDGFWSGVTVRSPAECWPRTGADTGYGRFRVRRIAASPLQAHRVAFVLMVDDIPPGITVDHICCHPPCCNPDHLQLVTAAENIRLRSARRDTGLCPAGHIRTGSDARGKVLCRECAREHARRNTQLAVTTHGPTGYKRGCRCDVCREAKRAEKQRWSGRRVGCVA